MTNLGDFFPEHERHAHSRRALVVGSVVRSPVPDTTPPKYKFWIIVGLATDGAELGVVYLNTNPQFLLRHPQLARLQLPMRPDARQLVTHDCYADCSELKRKSLDAIEQQLAEEPGYVRGVLEGHELATLLAALRTSPKISPRDKKRFSLV